MSRIDRIAYDDLAARAEALAITAHAFGDLSEIPGVKEHFQTFGACIANAAHEYLTYGSRPLIEKAEDEASEKTAAPPA